MGEAANKMSPADYRRRVDVLRVEIAHKRSELSAELEELKRRRADAMIRAKKAAKVAGVAAIGLVAAGSLLNAILDLFRSDEPETEETTVKVKQQSSGPNLTSMALGLAIAGLRTIAMQYVQAKMEELKADYQAKKESEAYVEPLGT